MAAWKVLVLAVKARQGWRRIPPAQRRALLEQGKQQAKKHGPTVAKAVREHGPALAERVGSAVRNARRRAGG